jgi:hypothetical protein
MSLSKYVDPIFLIGHSFDTSIKFFGRMNTPLAKLLLKGSTSVNSTVGSRSRSNSGSSEDPDDVTRFLQIRPTKYNYSITIFNHEGKLEDSSFLNFTSTFHDYIKTLKLPFKIDGNSKTSNLTYLARIFGSEEVLVTVIEFLMFYRSHGIGVKIEISPNSFNILTPPCFQKMIIYPSKATIHNNKFDFNRLSVQLTYCLKSYYNTGKGDKILKTISDLKSLAGDKIFYDNRVESDSFTMIELKYREKRSFAIALIYLAEYSVKGEAWHSLSCKMGNNKVLDLEYDESIAWIGDKFQPQEPVPILELDTPTIRDITDTDEFSCLSPDGIHGANDLTDFTLSATVSAQHSSDEEDHPDLLNIMKRKSRKGRDQKRTSTRDMK